MTDQEKHKDEHMNDPAAGTDDDAGAGHSDQAGGVGASRKRSESWKHAHEAFERLNVEEKAFFLVESAFETMLTGLREAGDAVKNAMDEALSDLEKKKQEARRRAQQEGEDGEGASAESAGPPRSDTPDV